MVNSSLIISSFNKKRHSNNSLLQNHINRTLNNANNMIWDIKSNKSKVKINSIKNYSTNIKKNKNAINNLPKNDILKYSDNIVN